MAVSKRLRAEIFRRDNHTCRYCGASAPDVKITIDHVTPTALGGSDKPENLVTACADCNSGKAATPPGAPLVQDVTNDTVRWAEAMKAAASLQAGKSAEVDEFVESIECQWTASWYEDPAADDTSTPYRHPGRRYAYRPADWADTVRRWMEAGLDLSTVQSAVTKARQNDRVPFDEEWRYTCGICWGILRDRQEIARQILAASDE